jgi:sec-independent protein translocase protein TatA
MTAQLAFGLGPWEMWVILLIALLLFGHRIPGMARSLGSGIVEFKRGLKGGSDETSGAVTSGTTPAPPAAPSQPSPPPEQVAKQGPSQGPSPDPGSANSANN